MNNLKIMAVAPEMFGEVWPYVGALFIRGCVAAEMPILESIDRVRSGALQLWTIAQIDPPRFLGVALTEIREDGGRWSVEVIGMAGERWLKWGRALSDRIAEFAKQEGCSVLRCCGRLASARVYGNCKVVGELRPGVAIMERAL